MRLAVLAVVSVFATATVLAAASDAGPSPTVLAAAAQRVQAAAAPPAATALDPEVSAPVAAAPTSTPVASSVADTAPAASSADAPAPIAPAKTTKPKTKPKPKPSAAGHVFVIALTGTGYQQSFGAHSPLPYLATELAPQGAVLSNFGPVDSSADLPNYLAFAGGIKPNAATRANCATYGDGNCVQPNTTLSLGDQVTSSGRSWRAYLEGMGDQTCRHPDNGTPDDTVANAPADGYVTRHNPFVYFHSLLDLGDCMANDVDLSKLTDDLKTARTTPNLAFIAPAVNDDADAFLKSWVPQIQGAPAYKKDGVLVIAFLSGPSPTGALVLSRYARKATLYAKPYDTYSLLRSIEALFALEPLGQAKKAPSFAKTVLTSAFEGVSQP
jgi:phosphatidylinositol-3-phosphatase